MPNLPSRLFAAVLAATVPLAATAYAAPPAPASGAMVMNPDGGVIVHEAWARATPGASTTGAAYVMLMGGSTDNALVGASTPAAASATVHETINDNGVMKMRPVPSLPIPAGGMVTFAPGGDHIMLEGLKQPLKAGTSFKLTLMFEHGPPVTVDVQVRSLAGKAPAMDHMHMN